MGEPESLATDEGLSAHIRRHGLDRLIMVSDGVFAIAVTLAAIEIHVPEHIDSSYEFTHHLLRPIAAYVLSFAVTALFWRSHRDLFARLKQVDGVLTVLTMMLLCAVALIPAMVGGIYSPSADEAGFRLYAATMIACGSVNSAMWLYAASRKGLFHEDVPVRFRWTRAIYTLVLPTIFGATLAVRPEQIPYVVLPAAVLVLLIRRIILPAIFARTDSR